MAATPATSLTLVTSGLQDARLQPPVGNPDISQFVKVLRKTTRWAARWYRVDFDGAAEFGQRVSMTLPRKAELVSGLNIVVEMPDIFTIQANVKAANPTTFLGPTYGWTNSLGHALIQLIELEIGGVIVDSLDSIQLEALDELYETVEASVAKNFMIARAPNGFGPTTFQGSATHSQKVYVPIPFWWSRPGQYANALPIDALAQDKVRIHVTFRPVNQLYYTDARVDPRTVGFRPTQDISGAMWGIQGARFWRSNPAATTRVYSMNSAMSSSGVSGELIPNTTFPLRLSPNDAYALVEYISLEEAESIAMRTAELTYRVPQHIQVPTINTNGNKLIRVPLPYANPVKEVYWVAQRPEVAQYNAWFLFTRDLHSQSSTVEPWWPDAQPVPTPENNWMVIPAFQESFSEPIIAATITYNTIERVVQDSGSAFRALVPAFHFTKSAIYDRYIYAYSFSQKSQPTMYEVEGFANWDKIPRKEMYLTMNSGPCGSAPPNMNVYVYLTLWNVFKVFGGRGGMLFTN
jgi:Major capsid protein N-terminus